MADFPLNNTTKHVFGILFRKPLKIISTLICATLLHLNFRVEFVILSLYGRLQDLNKYHTLIEATSIELLGTCTRMVTHAPRVL